MFLVPTGLPAAVVGITTLTAPDLIVITLPTLMLAIATDVTVTILLLAVTVAVTSTVADVFSSTNPLVTLN